MPGPMTRYQERFIYIVLAILVWSVVIWQAIAQPFVHDEARVYYNFIQVSDLLPFHTSWDAGNHLISSCGAWVTTQLFGNSHLSLRLFSVVCFVPYAWYGWRWGSSFHSALVRWPFLLSWMCTPFLIEFFSLFRGYGPGLAFLAMGTFHTVNWTRRRNLRDLVLALTGMALAVWSNLALVLVYGVVLVHIFLVQWPVRRSTPWHTWISLLLIGVIPWGYAVLYGQGLAENGALYYGTTAGLVDGTMASLLYFMLGFDGPFLRGMFTALILLIVAGALVMLWFKGFSSPLVFLAGAFALELLARYILFKQEATPYPMERTALHLGFMFILVFAVAVSEVPHDLRSKGRWAGLFLLIFPLCAFKTFSQGSTKGWAGQQVEPALARALVDHAMVNGSRSTVGGHEFMLPVVQLEAAALDMRLPMLDPIGHPMSAQDIILLDTNEAMLPSSHRIAFRSEHSSLVLAKRTVPCRRTEVASSAFQHIGPTADEFVNLFGGPVDEFNGEPLLLEVDGLFSTRTNVLEVDLVVEQRSAEGIVIWYHRRSLQAAYRTPGSCPIRCTVQLPVQQSGSLVIYLYNPLRTDYATDSLHAVLSTVRCE